MIKILFILTSLFGIGLAFGQSDSLVLDTYVIDTGSYNGRQIAIFNNGDWDYLDEITITETSKGKEFNGVVVFDPNDLFSTNWKNNRTTLGQMNCALMKDTVVLDISGFVKPIEKPCNSGFKFRWGRWHQGNDFAAVIGTPVKAAFKGKVRYAGFNAGGFGNLIIIRHYNGLETYYAHLSQINVKVNDIIDAGTIIGKVGNTGHSQGPHLHLEVRFFDSPFDPGLIFNGDKLIVCASIFKANSNSGIKYNMKEKLKISAVEEKTSGVKTIRKRKTFSTVK